jgi:hypothetical protein
LYKSDKLTPEIEPNPTNSSYNKLSEWWFWGNIMKRHFLFKFALIVTLFVIFILPGFVVAQSDTACSLDAVSKDVGQYTFLGTETDTPQVFLVQERHDIVNAQVEGAIMIHRLARDCGLRVIGLEAAFPDTSFDTSWFTSIPGETAASVAVQLLGEGEINQAEFAAMVYPPIYSDFGVIGIEDPELYNRETPDASFGELDTAMLYTSLAQLNEEDLTTAFELLDNVPPDDDPEALEAWRTEFFALVYTNNPNERIQEWDAVTSAEEEPCIARSAETELENIDLAISIVTDEEASTVSFFGLTTEISDALEHADAERSFYQDAHDRSAVMVQEIENVLSAHPGEPMVVIIGAAHTAWMDETLRSNGFSTVVVSPASYCDDSNAVLLNNDLYALKSAALSLDAPDELGGILSNSKKPPTVINQPWFRVKAYLYSVSVVVTEGLRANPDATLADILADFPEMPGVSINLDSLERVDDRGRWAFGVNLDVSGIQANEVFIGVATDISEGQSVQNIEEDLEQMLLDELESLQPSEDNAENADSVVEATPSLAEVAPGINAAFGRNKDSVVENLRGA